MERQGGLPRGEGISFWGGAMMLLSKVVENFGGEGYIRWLI